MVVLVLKLAVLGEALVVASCGSGFFEMGEEERFKRSTKDGPQAPDIPATWMFRAVRLVVKEEMRGGEISRSP